jgi:hypothetical protein
MSQTTTPPFGDDLPAPPPGPVPFEEVVAWMSKRDVRAEWVSDRWPRSGAYWRSDHC